MMSVQVLDTLGQKRPRPVLKLSVASSHMRPGDVLEVLGDCPTFETDIRTWCRRLGKSFISVRDVDRKTKRIQIRF